MVDDTLVENYARSGFMHALAFGRRPALLLVDLVDAYFSAASPLFGGDGCLQALRGATELLRAARAAAVPVVHTNVAYQPGGRDGGVFMRKLPALAVFEAGRHPEFTGFASGVAPAPGETVITKQYASAFFGTSLAATLTSSGIDTVLIGGVSTSGCVRATAVDCCQHGFVPVVVRDAVGDRAQGPHEANLFDLQAKYAEVVGLEPAKAYLAGLAGAG